MLEKHEQQMNEALKEVRRRSLPLNEMTASQKAAVLLLVLDKETASEVLRNLEPQEIHRLGKSMALIGSVGLADVRYVLEQFRKDIAERTTYGMHVDNKLKEILKIGLGRDADGHIARIVEGIDTRGLDKIKQSDIGAIASMLRAEHPQVIAAVCGYIDPQQASEVMEMIANEKEVVSDQQAKVRWLADILYRISHIGLQPSAMNDLSDIMARQFGTNERTPGRSNIGGVKPAGSILNYFYQESPLILEELGKIDPKTEIEVRDNMRRFEQLAWADENGFRALVGALDMEIERGAMSDNEVKMALAKADPNFVNLFLDTYESMHQRTQRGIFEDDVNTFSSQPLKRHEVDRAQKKIVDIAGRIQDTRGYIMFGRPRADEDEEMI